MTLFEDVEAYEAACAAMPPAQRPINAACLQGLLAATALSPVRVMPSVWIPLLWDLNESGATPVHTEEQVKEMLPLAFKMAEGIEASLGPERNSHFRPCYHFMEGCTPQDFCIGFQAGRRLMAGDWAELLALRPAWFEPFAMGAEAAVGRDALAAIDAVEVNLLRMHDYWHAFGARAIATYDRPEGEPQRIQRLADDLQDQSGLFPFAAVEQARQHREALSGILLARLQRVAASPDLSDFGAVICGYELAAALLGEWRDARAFEPLLAMARFDEAAVEETWGDSLNTLYMRALASTCAGRQEQMRGLILDAATPPFTRLALLEAWKTCVLEGDAAQDPWDALALQLCEAEAARLRAQRTGRRDDTVLALATIDLLSLGHARTELLAREWLREGLFHKHSLDEGDLVVLSDPAEARRQGHYIFSAEGEMAWWASYFEDEEEAEWEPLPPQPIVRTAPKVGRNDPCPCGSGSKYKKCHGAN